MSKNESNLSLSELKQSLINDLDNRVADRILEPANRDLLKKLINNAENKTEAISIAELGTTYKRTGFHFDKKLEKQTDTIKYFKKNNKLSFVTDENRLTHKLIIGDNYDALLNLSISYKGKIDVIYIDPPYGKDDLGDFAQTNYDNAITRDNLLSMLYPRLVLAKELLTDEGVIFCSIDDKNHAYVKGLFDEIFGECNFIGSLVREKKYTVQNDTERFSDNHDYILSYAKNLDSADLGRLPRTEKMNSAYRNPDNDHRGPWKSTPLHAKSGANSSPYLFPNGLSFVPPKGTYRRFNDQTMLSMYENNEIWFGKNQDATPSRKTFLSDVIKNNKGTVIPTLIKYQIGGLNSEGTDDIKSIFDEAIVFKSPKPVKLLKLLINIGTSKNNSTILDFFAGSGTTGHAVLELNKEDGGNRTFILCTNNEVTKSNPNGIAYDVTSKRLKRVMTGECYDGSKDFKWNKDHQPLGDNLDVYEIDQVSNINQTPGECAFDVIDETLYGIDKLEPKEKIRFVCENFSVTQKTIEE